ncbi:MAG: hypothetical protein LBV13_04880 [Methanomassiliicoccaceae archaeon]|nr:hypothetical protein [Methanomassiliicoccaceae archaeon]
MFGIHEAIGRIIEIIQCIEHNLAVIISDGREDADDLFDQMTAMPLYDVISLVERTGLFDKDAIDIFTEIRKERNRIVHYFFKDDFGVCQDDGLDERRRRYLNKRLDEMEHINSQLCKIIDKKLR